MGDGEKSNAIRTGRIIHGDATEEAWSALTTPPETILQEADRLVSDDRREDYGHPLDDFGRVTRMAHALWGRGPETEEEHAMYMILVKLARQVNRAKRDNLVDIAGYAKTLDLVIAERARRFTQE